MKKKLVLTGMGLLLAFGLLFTGCPTDGGGSGGGSSSSSDSSVTYTSSDGGNIYELTIAKPGMAYVAAGGDSYKLIITLSIGEVKISKGTVQSVAGKTLTLKSGDVLFEVTIVNGNMIAITGTIPTDKGSVPGPIALTPSSANPFKGIWEGTDTEAARDVEITFHDTDWLITGNGKYYQMGTYTYSGNTVTCTQSHEWDSSKDEWKRQTGFFTATVSGNTLSANVSAPGFIPVTKKDPISTNPFKGTWEGLSSDGQVISFIIGDTDWDATWDGKNPQKGTYTYTGHLGAIYGSTCSGIITVSENTLLANGLPLTKK
jgi:hypothetical protein